MVWVSDMLQCCSENQSWHRGVGPSVLPDRCLSVTLVYCGQTDGWIKMPLGMEVGLSPGHSLLDVVICTQLPIMERGTPTFRPALLWHGRPFQLLLSCWSLVLIDSKKSIDTRELSRVFPLLAASQCSWVDVCLTAYIHVLLCMSRHW